jgi:hypothetical protein
LLTKELRVAHVGVPQFEVDNNIREIVKVAAALKNVRGEVNYYYSSQYFSGKLPPEVRERYSAKLKQFLGKDEVSEEDLEQACKLDFRVKLDNETHEEAVVKHLVTQEDFVNFIKR